MEISDIVMIGSIILLVGAVIAIFIAVFRIVKKIRRVSRSLFGTDSIIEGISKQKTQMSETPRSLHAMTSVYLPLINKDFPSFDYELYKNKAKSLLRSYFTAIETKKSTALAEECSQALKNNVQGIIEDLNSRNVKQFFNESVIHDVQISRYIKTGSTVTILFVLSVGQYAYIEDENGKVVFGDKNLKNQTVYEVSLVYVQDIDKVGADSGLGINCPNCGAPIKNLGMKFCEYCGTGVVEVNERAWKFNSVNEQTTGRRSY
ncbi:MAG: zinc ribbon domain-containing protein [Ruminococcus sp.]|nr:zinc ribbon domain-containing protein [Ruminococcus sp.]